MNKVFVTIVVIFVSALLVSSCTRHHHHHHRHTKVIHMPPGQAKKITGSKSAKPFAPGQRKKYKNKHRH